MNCNAHPRFVATPTRHLVCKRETSAPCSPYRRKCWRISSARAGALLMIERGVRVAFRSESSRRGYARNGGGRDGLCSSNAAVPHSAKQRDIRNRYDSDGRSAAPEVRPPLRDHRIAGGGQKGP